MTQRGLFKALRSASGRQKSTGIQSKKYSTLDQIFDGEEMAEFAEWQMLREANEAHDRRMRHNPWFRLL